METEQKQRKPARTRRNFTDEFNASAVALVLKEGKSITRVAKDLDLTPSSLGKWVEQARADAGKSLRGTLTTEEKEELTRLRKENRELRVEREILKKAAVRSHGQRNTWYIAADGTTRPPRTLRTTEEGTLEAMAQGRVA